jgi:hypothetical protein
MSLLEKIYKLLKELNYRGYCISNQIHQLPDIDLDIDEYGKINVKTKKMGNR